MSERLGVRPRGRRDRDRCRRGCAGGRRSARAPSRLTALERPQSSAAGHQLPPAAGRIDQVGVDGRRVWRGWSRVSEAPAVIASRRRGCWSPCRRRSTGAAPVPSGRDDVDLRDSCRRPGASENASHSPPGDQSTRPTGSSPAGHLHRPSPPSTGGDPHLRHAGLVGDEREPCPVRRKGSATRRGRSSPCGLPCRRAARPFELCAAAVWATRSEYARRREIQSGS